MCVYVCVCVRERKRVGERERTNVATTIEFLLRCARVCVCWCACVCVREREFVCVRERVHVDTIVIPHLHLATRTRRDYRPVVADVCVSARVCERKRARENAYKRESDRALSPLHISSHACRHYRRVVAVVCVSDFVCVCVGERVRDKSASTLPVPSSCC